MLDTNKTYWRGIEELSQSPEFVKNAKNEFPDFVPSENDNGGTYRRDFLKLMGFGVAAATLAACETPVRKAIPYLNKPEDIDPSVPNWYSSTYVDGGDYCSIIVKTREGRPIKIEGNKNSSITKGAISARVAASVLSLYDKERFRAAKVGGNISSWEDLDSKVIAKLQVLSAAGKLIKIVTNTILSPSLTQAISEFTAKYPTASVVTYDANSASGILEANEKSFGVKAIPSYDFSKANVIVSFGADFLGTWLSPVEFTKGYTANRKLGKSKKTMSRHYQFETIMSLTGANADFRTALKPSQVGLVVGNLYNMIASKVGVATISVGEVKDVKFLQKAADDLLASKGKSLIVARSNDVNIQLLINAINNLLGNYGNTLTLGTPSYYRKGKDSDVLALINSMKAGEVGGVIFLNSNPVYEHPLGAELKAALAKVDLKVSISDRPNETTVATEFIAADHHYLESWSDAQPKKGFYSLGQPTISPLFKTRQAIETFLTWSGNASDAYSYVQGVWKSSVYPQQNLSTSFQAFWDNSLHDGVFEVGKKEANGELPMVSSPLFSFDIASVVGNVTSGYKANSSDIEYVIYEKIGIGTGSQANNPWLQELPEPISKATWDNYISVSQKFATEKGFAQGDIVKADFKSGKSVNLPILIQPGQAYNTVAFAIGYGREVAGKVANGVGKNVYPLMNVNGSALIMSGVVTSIVKTAETRELAQTQTHQTMMSRPIVQESVLSEYIKNPSAGRYEPKIQTSEGPKNPTEITLWDTKGLKTHDYNNHFWGLAIDLNSCIGCGSCVISCQAENNVPVVGRQEVINRREMHWIRIDRYYSSDAQNQEDKSVGV
jgi:MoCo/4Fe-4S cofactor protein with predicted Tat translocation signal